MGSRFQWGNSGASFKKFDLKDDEKQVGSRIVGEHMKKVVTFRENKINLERSSLTF